MIAILVIGVIFLSALAKIYFDTNYFKINKVDFYSNKLPKNSRISIAQLTDLHNKTFGNRLVTEVERIQADIIVITGDLIDRRTDNLENVFILVEQLTALNQHVYYVSGNHEWGNTRCEEFFSGLKDRNVKILDNKSAEITINNVRVNLVGIANYSTQHHNLNEAFAGVKNEYYTILLSHSPDIVKKFNSAPADLTLSGHTHGGQIRLPLVGAIIVPDQGFFPTLTKGIYKLGHNQYLYIDSGLGTSNLPVRFLNQSQFSVITIYSEI